MQVADAQRAAVERLHSAGIADAVRDARLLLGFCLQRDLAYLFAHPEHNLTEEQEINFHSWVDRRAKREPLQYITGFQEFYGLSFHVEPGVLIPRPETEIIVEEAIRLLSKLDRPVFFEAGLGSGCISISILCNVASATAIGSDLSDIAIGVTTRNAEVHGVSARLEALNRDLFAGLSLPVDLIVSNPPYIPSRDRETLQPEVAKFEPTEALFAGVDGLEVIRRILSDGRRHLKPLGYLLMEIGSGQAEAVKELAALSGWQDIQMIADLQGIPRTLKACRPAR